MGCREIISSRLYFCLKGTCSLTGRALLNIDNKLNNLIVKISQKAAPAAQNARGPCL